MAASGGDIVSIERDTPIDQQLVRFNDGAVLTQEDLNKAVQQLLYKQQEITGAYERSIGAAFVRLATRGAVPIQTEAILDDIAQEVVAREVVQMFQQRIADIDTSSQQLMTLQEQVDTLLSGEIGESILTLVTNETNARVQGDAALVDTLALIGARSGDSTAFIADLNKLMASPTESFAQRFSAISTRIGNAESAITSEATARATAIEAEARARSTLAARVGTVETGLTAEATARVNGDNALTETIRLLGARNATGTAFILDADKVQVGASGSLAHRLSGLTSSIDGISATIVQEQLTRAQADGSLAQQLNVLGGHVNNQGAWISTAQTVLNGLLARWSLQISSNGHVIGFTANNDGYQGSFVMQADRFSVAMPGIAPRTVFSVDANGVYMNGNVRIDGSLLVTGSVHTGSLPGNAISNSSYYQTGYFGSLSGFPENQWADMAIGSYGSGGSGGSGGGSGGGGGGYEPRQVENYQ